MNYQNGDSKNVSSSRTMALSVLCFRKVNTTLCLTTRYSHLSFQFYSAICHATTRATTYIASFPSQHRPPSKTHWQINLTYASCTTGIDLGLGTSNIWRLVAQSATCSTIRASSPQPTAPASSCSPTGMGKLKPIRAIIMEANHICPAFSWAWTTKSCECYSIALTPNFSNYASFRHDEDQIMVSTMPFFRPYH